jgi:3'(2'), 5'-bisphosphate nucleotidase
VLEKIDIADIVAIAKEAGDAIMEIYQRDFTIEYKDDKSPLTEADTHSNLIIVKALQEKYPKIPILSEEGKEIAYETRKAWEFFWLIDPIDGTKEFIKKNDEFTVNIALIHNHEPVLGVVYAPALGDMYYAKQGNGAYKLRVASRWSMVDGEDALASAEILPLAEYAERSELVVVASKSHMSPETEVFINALTTNDQRPTTISKGSSLKLCMVAEGEADIYPRLAPTMEWDTAAADAIVRESGKMTYQYEADAEHSGMTPVVYNKENLLNPWFVVR